MPAPSAVPATTHFILTGGPLLPQYRRAIKTAQAVGQNVVLWYRDDVYSSRSIEGVNPRDGHWTLPAPVPAWARDLAPAHVYDVLALQILHQFGGSCFGLDTITVAPTAHLVPDHLDLVASLEIPWEIYVDPSRYDRLPCEHPLGNDLVGRAGSDIYLEMLYDVERQVANASGDLPYGFSGPMLLTDFMEHTRFGWTDFAVLNGWEGGHIWRFYFGVNEPPVECHLIHLYASAYRSLFYDHNAEGFFEAHPDFREILKGQALRPDLDPALYAVATW